MEIRALTSPFEVRRVITYNTDSTKALYKNKSVRLVDGAIYCGEEYGDEYNKSCDIYALYDGLDVGIKLSRVSSDDEVEQVMWAAQKMMVDSMDSFLEKVRIGLERRGYFKLTELELMKHIRPELVPLMLESRKEYAEKVRLREEKKKARRDEEDRAFVKQRNAEADESLRRAEAILKNGGRLENSTIYIYKTRYDYSEYSIVNYLMRLHKVKVPIKTQGWIVDKLASATIKDGRCETCSFYKAKGAQCSQKFFGCMNALIAAVSAG